MPSGRTPPTVHHHCRWHTIGRLAAESVASRLPNVAFRCAPGGGKNLTSEGAAQAAEATAAAPATEIQPAEVEVEVEVEAEAEAEAEGGSDALLSQAAAAAYFENRTFADLWADGSHAYEYYLKRSLDLPQPM